VANSSHYLIPGISFGHAERSTEASRLSTGVTLLQEEWLCLLRIGRVSVAICRLSAGIDHLRRDSAGEEQAGKVHLDRDQLIARDRHSAERGFLCL
jgi:hypothetical protein